MSSYPEDIFGRTPQIGDYIAAGMSLGQSSVLRIGEIVDIKETRDSYSKEPTGNFGIRVRWRNNGRSEYSWDVKDSRIKWEPGYSYAKFVILDKGFVEQFPADIDAGL